LAIGLLIGCDYFAGFRLAPWLVPEGHWLTEIVDSYRGRLPWHLYYRLTMLRMVSHNLDKYWAHKKAPHETVSNLI
jgi:hypothetical protein